MLIWTNTYMKSCSSVPYTSLSQALVRRNAELDFSTILIMRCALFTLQWALFAPLWRHYCHYTPSKLLSRAPVWSTFDLQALNLACMGQLGVNAQLAHSPDQVSRIYWWYTISKGIVYLQLQACYMMCGYSAFLIEEEIKKFTDLSSGRWNQPLSQGKKYGATAGDTHQWIRTSKIILCKTDQFFWLWCHAAAVKCTPQSLML